MKTVTSTLRSFTTLILGLALVLTISGCDSTDSMSDEQETLTDPITVQDLPADPATSIGPRGPVGTGEYTFYSLREDRVVDDSTSTEWDIALQSTNMLINGGTSGPGNGAGYVAELGFEEVAMVDDGDLIVDDADAGTFAVPPGSGNGWYTYNSGGENYVRPIPGRTIVVRTGDGNGFAKIRIVSYYEGNPDIPMENRDQHPGRYYTFEYVYQSEGTSLQ